MTEEIIIDVNECPHKRDDECMEVPICNEYGDLMGYQSCEAQTLCPYRSQKKIERLEQENRELMDDNLNLSKENKSLTLREELYKADYEASEQENKELKATIYRLESKVDSMCNCNKELNEDVKGYKSALEEIRAISDNYNLTVNNRRKQIADKIKEVLK